MRRGMVVAIALLAGCSSNSAKQEPEECFAATTCRKGDCKGPITKSGCSVVCGEGEVDQAKCFVDEPDAASDVLADAGKSDGASTSIDTSTDACPYPIGGQPWDVAKGCWQSTMVYFECDDGPDAGPAVTCFVRVSTGEFFLRSDTQIPSGPDFRRCTESEQTAHPIGTSCK